MTSYEAKEYGMIDEVLFRERNTKDSSNQA